MADLPDFTDRDTWILSTHVEQSEDEPPENQDIHNFFFRGRHYGFTFDIQARSWCRIEPLPRTHHLAVLNDGLRFVPPRNPVQYDVLLKRLHTSVIAKESFEKKLQKCRDAFTDYDEMIRGLEYINTCRLYPFTLDPVKQYKGVCEIEETFKRYCEHYRHWMRPHYIPKGFFQYEQESINFIKRNTLVEFNKWAKRYYNESLETFEQEIVNGYNLYDMTSDRMSYETFRDLSKLWVEDLTDEEFARWLDEEHNCYSFWGRQDEHGDYYPLDRDYNQLKQDNFRALVALPYPRGLIKEIVSWNDLQMSVRYVNHACEWVKRNIKHVFRDDVVSLKQQAANVASKREYSKEELDQIPIECKELMGTIFLRRPNQMDVISNSRNMILSSNAYLNIMLALYNQFKKV